MAVEKRGRATSESRQLARADFRGDERHYFVRATYAPGGSYGTPSQRGYQLVAMLEGRARIEVEGKTVSLGRGEGILVKPGWRLLYLFSEDKTSIHTGCQVAATALGAAERRVLSGLGGTAYPLPAVIHTLIGEGLAAPAVGSAELHAAQLLLAKSCLLRFAAHARGGAGGGAGAPPPHRALHRARQVLETAPFELRTAVELAARAGVSVSRLRQLHRERGEESPSVLLWRTKAEQAVRMIRFTGLNLGEIAAQTGFANPFHLSRSVKRLTGRSPRELRRAEWGSE